MWTSLLRRTRRLSLFSLHFSSSSRTPSPYLLPSSHCLSSIKYLSHAPFSDRQEEDSRNVTIPVWWDLDSCKLPPGYDILKIAPSITAALRANGLKGLTQITVFGEFQSLDAGNWYNYRSSGIEFEIIPKHPIAKDRARITMLWRVLKWVEMNPPPAHLFFICGGKYFADLLHELRMQKYNILLASSDAPLELCSAATIMWHWNSLTSTMWDWKSMITGENFIGNHLNNPPDSPSGSWYGYLEVPIKNPSSTSTRNSKVLKVLSPTSALNEIHNIVKLYPYGISDDLLLSKLVKVDWKFGKKYFELTILRELHLPFSNILELEYIYDGERRETIVRSLSHKYPKPFEHIEMPSILSKTSEAEESLSLPKLGAETESTNTDYDAKFARKPQAP